MARLEKILGVGLMGALMFGCGKAPPLPSEGGKSASKLYNDYKLSVGKEETREEAEKNIAALMGRYFNTSKTKDFDTFWDCQSKDLKETWSDSSIGYLQYQNHWTIWVYGNPEIRKINSIHLSDDLRSGEIKIHYLKSIPYVGARFDYPDAEFGVKRENGKWVFRYESQGSDTIVERFEPKTEETLPTIRVSPKY